MTHRSSSLWLCLFCNTESLTCLTPIFDNFSHTWPIASLSDQLYSALNALVAMMGVQLLEHLFPQTLWNYQLVHTLATIRPLICPVQTTSS